MGWCILSLDGKLAAADAISFDKKYSIFQRAQQVKKQLIELKKSYGISRIFIEENLQAFRPGFSSAKTIVTLARFNGIVTFLSNEVFCTEPSFLNVNSARKSVGLKIERKSPVATKDQVLQFAKSKIPNFCWPTRTLKSGPRKDLVIPADCCYDIADAYVIALAGFVNE